jgi:hypothetical protein
VQLGSVERRARAHARGPSVLLTAV